MTDLEQSKLIISSAPPVSVVEPNALDDKDEAGELAEFTEFELRETKVPIACHAERLDRALALIVPEFSRSYLQQLIASGAVVHNGKLQIKSSAKVKAGDSLGIELKPTPQSQAFKPEAMALDVVYEDEFLLVINKPAGLVVHPAPGNWSGTLLNGLLARDPQAYLLPRAGIVHRLDKDTSGLMAVAKTRPVMDQLVQLIAARSVNRLYIALAHQSWSGAKTRHIDLPVGRDPKNRLRMAVVDLMKNSGKTATTDITLLDNVPGYCMVLCKLHTGRTHQIRVHMAAAGHPLVSDTQYGGAVAGGLQRQALHAWCLAFAHPTTGQSLVFRAALPDDMQGAMSGLGVKYNVGVDHTGLS